MTTYIRPAAVARDDADMLAGWNISPNTGHTLQLSVTASEAVVLLLSADGSTLIGSGTTSIGAAQPVTITPVSGQAVDMADPSLGWHLLLTTDGTEGARSITMDPIVDLPARTHPVYADDGLSLAVATADINAGTHYTQDVTASCPLGFVAGVGDTASVPVDDVAVVGQVESVTWAGTPDGSTAQAVIREHIQIRPDAYVVPVPPTPPTVVDDDGTTDAATTTSGNVLTNDSGGTLTVSAVNDLAANVGQIVTGSNGGDFVISADGSWTFDPAGDFALLTGSETADTSLTYHASDGVSEAMATLSVTVSAVAGPVPTDDRWADVVFCINANGADGSTVITDAKGLTVSRFGDTQIDTSLGYPAVQFDGTGDYLTIPTSAGTRIESGVFTLDAWIYFDDAGVRRGIVGNRHSSAASGMFVTRNSDNTIYVVTLSSSPAELRSAPVSPGLHHVEVSVDSARVCRIFVDGILSVSGNFAAGAINTSNPLYIGREQHNQFGRDMMARCPAMRITRGTTVRHTDDFTPPPYPFPTA